MKKKKRSDHISTILGIGTTIEGTLKFKDTIRLDGRVNGDILSEKGTIIIGERANVKAQIRVCTAVIKGEVDGQVQATERIEVYPPAKITGDIQAPVISIEPGVFFNGNCSMTRSETAVEKPPSTDAENDEEKLG
jgi:cytoskeletal protein CcmA (bactofilin family)